LGISGYYKAVPQSVMVCLGLVLFVTNRAYWEKSLSLKSRFQKSDWLWLIFPLLYALARFFVCGIPQEHGDPLYYHLAAPKLWAQLGQIRLTESHPSFSQAVLWETVFGIPQLWFGTEGVRHHVLAQLFGQWMHFFWGQVTCVAAAYVLIRRFSRTVRESIGPLLFFAWISTTFPSFEWLGSIAKNDYVLSAFVLTAVIEALTGKAFLAGILIGFGCSIKIFGAWAGIALIALLVGRGKTTKRLMLYVLGGTLAVAPFVTRNLIWTKNPLFPSLDPLLGPHWISQWWNDHNASFISAPRIDASMLKWFWERPMEKMLPKVFFILGIGFSVFELFQKKIPRELKSELKRWLVFISIQLVFILSMLSWGSDGRYANFCLASISIFFAAVVLRVLKSNTFGQRYVLPVFLGLGLLVSIPLDQVIKIPKRFLFESPDRYVDQFHAVYRVQKWVNANVSPGSKILFMAEKQHFYLDHEWETVPEMKKWEEILAPIRSLPELFTTLNKLGYRYVHFTTEGGGYPPPLRSYWKDILAVKEKAVYQSSVALIFDLRKF